MEARFGLGLRHDNQTSRHHVGQLPATAEQCNQQELETMMIDSTPGGTRVNTNMGLSPVLERPEIEVWADSNSGAFIIDLDKAVVLADGLSELATGSCSETDKQGNTLRGQ